MMTDLDESDVADCRPCRMLSPPEARQRGYWRRRGGRRGEKGKEETEEMKAGATLDVE